MEIKSAEKILIEQAGKINNYYLANDIIEAMKEYAAQFIELAAEVATCSSYESSEVIEGYSEVNKQSILEIKNQLK